MRDSRGVRPKTEARKLETLFSKWKGVCDECSSTYVHAGVSSGNSAADRGGREYFGAESGAVNQAQCAVSMARCLSQGGGDGTESAGRTSARNATGQAIGQCAGSRAAADRGARAKNRPATGGKRFFKKSLQACRGVAPEEIAEWRNGIYAEIRRMMQPEGKPMTNPNGFTIEVACEVAQVSRAGFLSPLSRTPAGARLKRSCAIRSNASRWAHRTLRLPARTSGVAQTRRSSKPQTALAPSTDTNS